jgi:hypothetical protein
MKYFSIIILFLSFFGCKNTIKNEIDLPISKILKNELIDFIPYLVAKNNIDTLYQIITEGEVGITSKGDTLSSYINISDTINYTAKTIMCCHDKYLFENDLLIFDKKTSDYTVINTYKYTSDNQTIFKIGQNKFLDTTIFKIAENKIIWELELRNDVKDTTFYFYKDGFLIKKITTDITPHLPYRNTKYISEFRRNPIDNSISKVIYTSVNTIQILNFDKSGIPKESIMINYDSFKSDTICKTRWTSPTLVR